MRKKCTFLILLLIVFSISLTLAETNQTEREEKITKGFECLEKEAKDCSDLSTQEIALTILATPSNIFDDCVKELESRESSDHWGNIRDTALAILALKHAGKDTEPSEDWLISQNRTPTDIDWFLQQDSQGVVTCNIGYDSEDYEITINKNKKIDKNAGSCLRRTSSSFWLQIDDDCYDEKFKIECNQKFIVSLLYKNSGSSTVYPLKGTVSAPAFGSIDLQVKSSCFGDSSCDYEETAWAALALQETGHNIEAYIPYIIAMSETNQEYLPEAFIYILTNYEDYATSLIEEQEIGRYWEAESSAYSKVYDTSLALIALSSSTAEQVEQAKDWLIFSQDSNGCWDDEVIETAIALWALEGKPGKPSNPGEGGDSVTYCTQAGFFCIPSSECPSAENYGDNYFCPSLSDTCCETENLKTCKEYSGEECDSEKVCTGNSRKSSDVDICCTGTCAEKIVNECEDNFYTCMDSCSDYQEPISQYDCGSSKVCCKTKTSTEEGSSTWWIWLLLILILGAAGAAGYFYREQLKLYWFQIKIKFKKDKGNNAPSSGSSPPSIPPRPGFPPVRRPHPPMARQGRPVQNQPQKKSYDRRDKAMSDTFKTLQDMSK